MIFYNGFNLMVDIILAVIVWRVAYRAGWARGFGEGEEAYRDYSERAGDYWLEMEREREH